MSDKSLARHTSAQIVFAGTDITNDIAPYLLSVDYTDAEGDETDDLQIKLLDNKNLWVQKWLNTAITASAGGKVSTVNSYMVTSQTGCNIRSGASDSSAKIGSFAYGATVGVLSVSGKWARILYGGKDAYIKVSALSVASDSGSISVGDTVIATGQPQFTSYGEGTPGSYVTNYEAKITYLNKNGSYPYHVGQIGWFSASQVKKKYASTSSGGSVQGATSTGMSIQANFIKSENGKETLLECGQFELDSVTAQAPPRTVTIKGTSLPYASTVRQTVKSRSWENYSLKGIATEIANGNGMGVLYESKQNPIYDRVEQYRQSDIAFLKQLCKDCGANLKVTNNIIVIFNKQKYENKKVVLSLKNGDGQYTSYNLKSAKDSTYTSCTVSYTTPQGKVITATAYIEDYKEDSEKNQDLKITQKVSSVTEAKTLAEYHLKLHNSYELTASFTLPGNPRLLAGCTVSLSGWGGWNGKYIISQAKHSISSSGYVTSIDLRKVIVTNLVNSQTSESDTSLDDIARAVIRGDYGNGDERKRRLKEAGYNYSEVQARVNAILYG